MPDPLKVFVASTTLDIPEYRTRLREAIKKMGHVPVMMEDVTPDGRSALDIALGNVRSSDVLIALVGHTYGVIPDANDYRSFTWREVAEAVANKKRVLAFELDPNVRTPIKDRDRLNANSTDAEVAKIREAITRLAEFRAFLAKHVPLVRFSTAEELAAAVTIGLRGLSPAPDANPPVVPPQPVTGALAKDFYQLRRRATLPWLLLTFLILVATNLGFVWRESRIGKVLDGYMLGWSLQRASTLFTDLGVGGRRLYAITEVTFDALFPALYGYLFLLLIARFASARFRWLFLIPILAVLADYTENLSIAFAFSRSTLEPNAISIAQSATPTKWALVFASLVVVTVAATIRWFSWRERKWKGAEHLGEPAPEDPFMTDLTGVLERELLYIRWNRHPSKTRRVVSRNLVGLALSGGGIRSATTNLGILQALSRMSILPMVDYVSTVSGGGYIGACLSSLLSWNRRAAKPDADGSCSPFTFEPGEEPRYATDWASFPFRAEISSQMPTTAGAGIVAHLRTHGNFLIARWGVFRRETMRSIGTLLTGIVYHVLLFVTALFAVSALYFALMIATAPDVPAAFSDSGGRQSRDSLAAVEARNAIQRPGVVAVDSTMRRVGRMQCEGCEVRATLEPPSLWQRFKWNVGVIRHAVIRTTSAWTQPAQIPRPLQPILWAFVLGIALSLGAYLWIRRQLGDYVAQKNIDKIRPKRGESDDDAFERRVLFQLAGALTIVYAIVIGFRYGLWKSSQGNIVDAENQVLWLFTPLAAAIGARLCGFVISVLGQSYDSSWTRRTRSLWGAFQGVSIYGTWVTLLFAVLPLAFYALADNTTGIGWSAVGSIVLTRLLTSRTAGKNGEGAPRISKVPAPIRNGLLGVAVTLVLLLSLLYFDSLIAPRAVDLSGALGVLGLAALLFATVAWSVNPNRLSPHYFYRDRLAETYLLTDLPDRDGRMRLFRDAMEMPLRCLHGDLQKDMLGDFHNTAPYHLISAAINMAGSRDLTRKDRKSGYWLFSKFYCGSVHTGFRETSVYRKGETTLARAVAISGAAASSAMGQITFFAQAFATVLFNVRLGQWIENPAFKDSEQGREPEANWPSYLWRELTTDTVETTRLVNLSDGGHTGDNVGIYPLLQRRCKVIIACDAEADSALTFGSFTEALRHAYVDMGIDVDVDLTMIRPDPATGRSRSHCAVGRIRYPDRPHQESFLIYMKNSLTGDEPEPVLNYKARSPAFPHETTADQFFDDAQFESYRALGVHIAEHTFGRWVRSLSFPVAKSRHHPAPPAPPPGPSINPAPAPAGA